MQNLILNGRTATQLLQNGNIASGTTGWGAIGGTISASAGILSCTANGSASSCVASYAVSLNNTNKYYTKVRFRVTNANCTSIKLRTNESADLNVEYINPVINTWYTVDKIFTMSTTSTQFWLQHYYVDSATASGKVMEVDYLYAVNLTTT